jgi:WD40 repeat protein
VLATGGADSFVSICRWGGALAPTDDAAARVVDGAARVRCDAPVICVGFGQVGGGASMVAAGCMDGSVKLVEYGAGVGDATSGMGARLLKTLGDDSEATTGIKHAKYVKVVAWSASASLLASASADGSIQLSRVGQPDEDGAVKIEKVQTMHLPGSVEAMCFLDDGDTLCAYARDTAYLSYFDLKNLDSEGATQTKVTVNESCVKGFEEHVSFAIMCLVPSPNGKYVAAATDTSRNIIFEKGSPRQVRNLYGHKNDGFSVPKIAWSSNGQYIYGNTQDDCSICVWDIASGDIVNKLDDKMGGHTGQVREIFSSPTSDTVATASFDKTAKIWLPKMG